MLLVDGFQTLITVMVGNLAPTILREREVQPPDLERGEIDTVTMRNSAFRTKQPKTLTTVGDVTLQCQYDPACYTTLLASMGIVGTFTVRFPDGSTTSFLGWIDKFTPTSHKEGEFPIAEVKIKPSMQSAVPALVEGAIVRVPGI